MEKEKTNVAELQESPTAGELPSPASLGSPAISFASPIVSPKSPTLS